MHDPLGNVGKWLGSVIRGFTNYHAVPGNMNAPREFYTQIGRIWIRVIRRRSHKAKCRWTWQRFYQLAETAGYRDPVWFIHILAFALTPNTRGRSRMR